MAQWLMQRILTRRGVSSRLDLASPGGLRRCALGKGTLGIAILAKNHVFSHLAFKSFFDFDHSSFELVQTTLTLQKRSVHFFCLYRPPPSLKNKLTDSLFLEQFPKLLDLANSICGNFLILGDFNFHFDCPTSSHMLTILDYMHMFNLAQSVNTPLVYVATH